MKMIQVTLQERWAASRHKVHKSKKSYSRKEKHGGKQARKSSPL
jgi:stalled ribosome alternative rescue factor ArfA